MHLYWASTEAHLHPPGTLYCPFFGCFTPMPYYCLIGMLLCIAILVLVFFDECHLFDDNVHMCVNEEES